MWKKVIESLLLLTAVALLIPLPPSDPSPIPFLPAGAVAALFFLASRALRHAGRGGSAWVAAALETGCFLAIAWLVNRSANILAGTL